VAGIAGEHGGRGERVEGTVMEEPERKPLENQSKSREYHRPLEGRSLLFS
jgi:hypothetical protein